MTSSSLVHSNTNCAVCNLYTDLKWPAKYCYWLSQKLNAPHTQHKVASFSAASIVFPSLVSLHRFIPSLFCLHWNTTLTVSRVNKALTVSLAPSVLDFTSPYPSSRRDGGKVAGGFRVSSSNHMNRDRARHLLLQLHVWISLFRTCCNSQWRGSLFGHMSKEFKGPSHYMQQKLVSGHHCGGGGGKPLICGTSAAKHLAL